MKKILSEFLKNKYGNNRITKEIIYSDTTVTTLYSWDENNSSVAWIIKERKHIQAKGTNSLLRDQIKDYLGIDSKTSSQMVLDWCKYNFNNKPKIHCDEESY